MTSYRRFQHVRASSAGHLCPSMVWSNDEPIWFNSLHLVRLLQYCTLCRCRRWTPGKDFWFLKWMSTRDHG